MQDIAAQLDAEADRLDRITDELFGHARWNDERWRLEEMAARVREHARLLRLGVVGVAELRPRAASAASGEPAADASPAASCEGETVVVRIAE